ncbi:hypothetical protein PR202_ga20168 [Eleusine coracana subsp. coracana]|uniref:Xylanase inhibitor N-terminal domain-containing protein n=1 Tax=Eleusine coracana subsp. coracana TaxID=191504 RepID=A0AAV5CY18_ELECO|nr:hypothetical protein PR202_ga20168 [Eleusine coracana subsp. coracana]
MDKLVVGGNVFHGVVFGCSDSASTGGGGPPPPQASSGLVGLGRGPLSLVSQLSVRRFMYCLPPPLSRTTGKLVLGADADAVRNATDRVAVTMSSDARYPSYYYLNLDGLAVGDRTPRDLNNNNRRKTMTSPSPPGPGDRAHAHGMIVDIASTISFLEASLYEELADDLEQEIRLPRGAAFSHGPRNMATISPVRGDESGKPYRRLPTSSGEASIVLQGAKHSAITQGKKNFNTDSSKKRENIETKGTISLVDEYDTRSEKDACRTALEVIVDKHDEWGQTIYLTDSEEDQTSATKDQTVSDDEEYTEANVLEESGHRDGSIYRGMDAQIYCQADRCATLVCLAVVFSDLAYAKFHPCLQATPTELSEQLACCIHAHKITGQLHRGRLIASPRIPPYPLPAMAVREVDYHLKANYPIVIQPLDKERQ